MSAAAERWRGSDATAIAPRPMTARLANWRLRISWDAAAFGAILLAGFALRFYDLGSRAIHHDESLHATYSLYLFRGQGYIHDPLMHGPFLFHAMALVYLLLGVSDATARVVPAALGTALIALPWLLRGRLGRAGALVAAALIAFSPTLLYFSRFVGAGAQDIVLAVTALLIVAAIWRYLEDGRPRWLYLIAGALSVSFATKEVTFMLAVIFLLWLNGLLAAGLARQNGGSAPRAWLRMLAIMPIAWAVAALWPALSEGAPLAGLRRHLGWRELPRVAAPLLVLGLFTVPQFAAAVEIPLAHLGYSMDAPSRISGLSNTALFGGVTVGLLIAATTITGLLWRPRDFLLCAAIFWGIYILLFTTFFTNMEGFATGIWGSLDYWLQQQGEERGKQPVFYYAMLTPIYEYLALLFAGAGIVRAALKGGRWTALALAASLACVLLGVRFGRGDVHGAPFAMLALAGLALALRRDPFRSFLAFWAGSMFFGLSVAGEKMPWLETHLALPLALLAALTISEALASLPALLGLAGPERALNLLTGGPHPPAPSPNFVRGGDSPGHGCTGWSAQDTSVDWNPDEDQPSHPLSQNWERGPGGEGQTGEEVRPQPLPAPAAGRRSLPRLIALSLALAAGALGAALLLWPGDVSARVIPLLATLALALAAVGVAGWRSRAGVGLAATLAVCALLAPLTVRDAWRASFTFADTPKDLLIYTQTSPNLRAMAARVDELARSSGQGAALPITVDSSEAFTWPWAWYLRDYTNVLYLDLSKYRYDPALARDVRPAAVLFTLSTNADVANLWPDRYGPGETFPHRWWFPEDYRATTGPNVWRWLHERHMWAGWMDFFLHRTTRSRLGEIDSVAFFQKDLSSVATASVLAAPKPREDAGRLIAGAAGKGPGLLAAPAGLAVGPDGAVYVADTGNNRIQKFSAEGSFLSAADGAGRFNEPWGVAAGGDGSVYVADTWNHRIVKLDRDLRTLATWGGPVIGPEPPEPGPLSLFGPRAIAIDAAGNLWVTDTGHNRVVEYDPNGRPLGVFGSRGSGPGQFQEPAGITITPSGDFLVADTWNGRVQRFDSSFRYRDEFPVAGWGDHNAGNKPSITALSDGTAVLSVPDAGVVERYSADGRRLETWTRFSESSGAQHPLGVASDGHGAVWVSASSSGELARRPVR